MCSVHKARKMAKKTAMVKADDSEGFEWTEQRLRCVDLMIAGIPKTAIARELRVHRNTIGKWTSNPEFISKLRADLNEHIGVTRQRRLMETNNINNKMSKLATNAVDRVLALEEKMAAGETVDPKKMGNAIRNMREFFHEFRAFREEERKDVGDDVKRIETRGTMHHYGDVNVSHTSNDTAFSDFLADNLEKGIIDADILEEVDTTKVLPKAVEHVLIETDILDIIDEEDMALEE